MVSSTCRAVQPEGATLNVQAATLEDSLLVAAGTLVTSRRSPDCQAERWPVCCWSDPRASFKRHLEPRLAPGCGRRSLTWGELSVCEG
jgi:hypothetical protein